MSDKSEKIELAIAFGVFVYTVIAALAFLVYLICLGVNSEIRTENNIPYYRECDRDRDTKIPSK